MDALSDILRMIRLQSTVYFRSDFHSPWGMDMDAGPFAQFHIVVRGSCYLNIAIAGRSISRFRSILGESWRWPANGQRREVESRYGIGQDHLRSIAESSQTKSRPSYFSQIRYSC
jgi:hypothetical protein